MKTSSSFFDPSGILARDMCDFHALKIISIRQRMEYTLQRVDGFHMSRLTFATKISHPSSCSDSLDGLQRLSRLFLAFRRLSFAMCSGTGIATSESGEKECSFLGDIFKNIQDEIPKVADDQVLRLNQIKDVL
jgi:hypothetical protein